MGVYIWDGERTGNWSEKRGWRPISSPTQIPGIFLPWFLLHTKKTFKKELCIIDVDLIEEAADRSTLILTTSVGPRIHINYNHETEIIGVPHE